MKDKIKENYKTLFNQFDNQNEMSFMFNGVSITNPFMDESGRYEVNPITYYGSHFIESRFKEVIKSL